MLRFEALASAVEAAYPGNEPWYIGAEHVHSHEDALNRIVAYPIRGTVVTPGIAGQGWSLEDLSPTVVAQINSVDDIIAVRKLECSFSIWAENGTLAENRLHALIVALTDVLDASNLTLENLTEEWPQAVSLDITSGGSMVNLNATVALYVIASDINAVTADSDSDIGQGAPTEAVTGVTIIAQQETEDGTETIATIVIEEET